MILSKPGKTLLSAASISLVLLALVAGGSMAQSQSDCSCCEKCPKTAS